MKYMKPKREILDTDAIQPDKLRLAVRESQERKTCTNELAEYLLNIHDIVLKTQSFFLSASVEEKEEARSYSLERWLTSGIYKINLEAHYNPFSYIYAGVYLNMLNRIMRLRKSEEDKAKYTEKVLEEFRSQFPEMSMVRTENNDDNY